MMLMVDASSSDNVLKLHESQGIEIETDMRTGKHLTIDHGRA